MANEIYFFLFPTLKGNRLSEHVIFRYDSEKRGVGVRLGSASAWCSFLPTYFYSYPFTSRIGYIPKKMILRLEFMVHCFLTRNRTGHRLARILADVRLE